MSSTFLVSNGSISSLRRESTMNTQQMVSAGRRTAAMFMIPDTGRRTQSSFYFEHSLKTHQRVPTWVKLNFTNNIDVSLHSHSAYVLRDGNASNVVQYMQSVHDTHYLQQLHAVCRQTSRRSHECRAVNHVFSNPIISNVPISLGTPILRS